MYPFMLMQQLYGWQKLNYYKNGTALVTKKSWKLLNTLIAITKLIICITPKNKLPTLSNRILDWVISYNSSLCMSRPLQLQDSIFQKIMIQCFNDLALIVHIIMQLLYVCIHDVIIMFILYVLRIALKSLT